MYDSKCVSFQKVIIFRNCFENSQIELKSVKTDEILVPVRNPNLFYIISTDSERLLCFDHDSKNNF